MQLTKWANKVPYLLLLKCSLASWIPEVKQVQFIGTFIGPTLFKNMDQSLPLCVYFRPFLITISIIQIEKRVDGVHGIWTRCCRMVGTDETMELWRIHSWFESQWRIRFFLSKSGQISPNLVTLIHEQEGQCFIGPIWLQKLSFFNVVWFETR